MPPRQLRGYIEMGRVSKLLGEEWPVQRVRRWLKRDQACVLIGRYYYTTKRQLKRAYPDVFEDLFLQEF